MAIIRWEELIVPQISLVCSGFPVPLTLTVLTAVHWPLGKVRNNYKKKAFLSGVYITLLVLSTWHFKGSFIISTSAFLWIKFLRQT